MENIRFDGQVAVVTGAGAGLGKAYALELAHRGASLIINDLNSHSANTTVEQIRQAGGTAIINIDSVATINGGEHIIQAALDTYGRIDILINNAGFTRDKSFTKMSEDDWDQIINVHLKGAFCVTKPAFSAMRTQAYGRIIMTTSGAALYGNFGQANYTAAKMGVVGLMNALKIEGDKYNIKVNAIAPVAATQLTAGVLPPEIFEKLKPDFIVPLVVYLCSKKVSDNGSIFNCIGGWYGRTAIQCAPGIIIDNGNQSISAEDIESNWDAINSLDGSKYLSSVVESFGFLGPILS